MLRCGYFGPLKLDISPVPTVEELGMVAYIYGGKAFTLATALASAACGFRVACTWRTCWRKERYGMVWYGVYAKGIVASSGIERSTETIAACA